VSEPKDKYLEYRRHITERTPVPKTKQWDYLALHIAVMGIIGLVILYLAYILAGQHFYRGIFSLIDVVEGFSGTVFIINTLALIFGIISIFLSNRKKFSIATIILGSLVITTFLVFGRSIAIQ
jgi:hypothetical protein